MGSSTPILTKPAQMATLTYVLVTALTFFTLLFVILFALTGNIFVVAAVLKFPRLRSEFCYHILSGLAIADICVALFVMPWSMVNLLWGYWPFDDISCRLWMSSDVMCCTASILHLCLVAMDRYVAVVYPLRYRILVNGSRVRLGIIAVWITSITISFIPINFGWFSLAEAHFDKMNELHSNFSGINVSNTSNTCELKVNRVYAVVSSLTSFYLPFLFFCLIYGRIYWVVHQQVRQFEVIKLNFVKDERSASTITTIDEIRGSLTQVDPIRFRGRRVSSNSQLMMFPRKFSMRTLTDFNNGSGSLWMSSFTFEGQGQHEMTGSITDNSNTCFRDGTTIKTMVPTTSTITSGRRDPTRQRRRSKFPAFFILRRELKAIKTIGLILGCFTVCWLPFFVTYVMRPFCDGCCHFSRLSIAIITWIGYVNSVINPILYGFLQRDFRTAFLILTRLIRQRVCCLAVHGETDRLIKHLSISTYTVTRSIVFKNRPRC